MVSDRDGFINRWSRRKSETADSGGLRKKGAAVETREAVVEPIRGRMITDPLPVAPLEPAVDGPVDDVAVAVNTLETDEPGSAVEQDADQSEVQDLDLEELESIDIEALDFNADFTKFMQPGVPERLRQRALRRLWNTNPVLANVDGLNDYDEDYTDAALAVDVLKSAWKVGQGYLTDEEVEARDAERLGDPEDAEAEIAETSDAEVADVVVESDAATASTDVDSPAGDDDGPSSATSDDTIVDATTDPVKTT